MNNITMIISNIKMIQKNNNIKLPLSEPISCNDYINSIMLSYNIDIQQYPLRDSQLSFISQLNSQGVIQRLKDQGVVQQLKDLGAIKQLQNYGILQRFKDQGLLAQFEQQGLLSNENDNESEQLIILMLLGLIPGFNLNNLSTYRNYGY